MLDRASTFSDPRIVELLKTKFVPVAIDQAYHRRQQDTEGEFYRKLAGQGPRSNFNGTTQGLYIGTAGGKLLAYNNNRGPDRIYRRLTEALREYQPEQTVDLDEGKPDPRYARVPPVGGLVVRVNAKVLNGYEPTDDPWREIFQSAISRDNLWVTKQEHQQLCAGKIADSLQNRLVRFHLVDNTRGEPPMWDERHIKKLDLQLSDGKLTGRVHLETPNGDRGYQCDLLGVVETSSDKVVRFDIVAKGEFWGEGTYTRGAPKGKFPLAVAFRLADGKDEADKVPPQASRGWLRGYIQ